MEKFTVQQNNNFGFSVKFTIKQIKKDGIWVKCTGNDAKKFLMFIGAKYERSDYSNRFYRYNSSNLEYLYDWDSKEPNSFIEFSQVIFDEPSEINHYECIQPLFKYKTGDKLVNNPDCAKLPEYFKPIYKNNYEKGDIVISVIGTCNYIGEYIGLGAETDVLMSPWEVLGGMHKGQRGCGGAFQKVLRYATPEEKEAFKNPQYKIGDAITITEVLTDFWIKDKQQRTFWIIGGESMYFGGLCFMLSDAPDGKQIGGYPKSSFRHATKEEIEFANKVKIGEYEVLINTTTGMASINGVGYSGNHLQYLLEVMEKGQIKSLNCGCNGQYKVDLETIRRIIKKFN